MRAELAMTVRSRPSAIVAVTAPTPAPFTLSDKVRAGQVFSHPPRTPRAEEERTSLPRSFPRKRESSFLRAGAARLSAGFPLARE